MGTLGIQDVPVRDFGQDSLGIGQYAKALKEFILKCKTPMTIAIQGDWGSGKTSLMELIKKELGSAAIPIEFNTWQFSQFNLAEEAPALMMRHFADEIAKGPEGESQAHAKQMVKSVWKLVRKTGGMGAALALRMAGASEEDQKQLRETVDSALAPEDPLEAIKSAKRELTNMVKERLTWEKNQGHEATRVVLFIDDLDRLAPSRAVELLEVMKVLLDIEGCVFLLACDFEIVRKGVSEKFKFGGSEFSGKSFFDKIFQLSFHMPIARYKKNDFLSGLMDQVGFKYDKDDLEIYLELLSHSIGFNARNIKRLFNSLVLLKSIPATQHSQADDRLQRVVFAVNCMEMAFTPLYNYLMRQIQEKESDLDKLLTQDLRYPEKILQLSDLRQIFADSSDKERMAAKISDFVGVFVKCLQIDDDPALNKDEIKQLIDVMDLTSLTSSTGQQQVATPDTWQDDISKFCRRVKDNLYQTGLKLEHYSKKAIAGSTGRSPWRDYSFWYDREWQQWALSYHLTWWEVKKDFWVTVRSNWGDRGLNKEQVKGKLEALQSHVNQGKFTCSIRDELGFLEILTRFGPLKWDSEDDVSRVVDTLKQLITETQGLFDVV